MFYKSTILYGSLFYGYQCSLQSKIIATENRDPIDNRMFSLTFFLSSNYTSRLSESHILWPHRVFCDLLYTLIIPCANNNSDEFFFFFFESVTVFYLSFPKPIIRLCTMPGQCWVFLTNETVVLFRISLFLYLSKLRGQWAAPCL